MSSHANKWANKVEFVLSLIGFAIGLGNIWRFPYLCHRNGGGVFLIPYLTSMLLCGMPLFVLEVSLSQFSGFGVTRVWDICPLFKGVGYAMAVMCAVVSAYYNSIITWIVYYLIRSFAKVLPWSTCDNEWNTPLCWIHKNAASTNNEADQGNFTYLVNTSAPGVPVDEMAYNITGVPHLVSLTNDSSVWKSPADEFWHIEALTLSNGIEELGGLRWDLVGCMALSWIVVFLFICKGAQSIGKVVYVTALMPYLLLTVMVVRGLLLPGSMIGIKYYLIPRWHKLLEFQVWAEATMQILYSIGPCFGPLFVMASYNKFHNNCIRDAVIVSLIGCSTSFFAGFVIFSVLGFMAFQTGQTVDEVIASGPGLVFIAYPEAISKMPIAPFWAILFFLMLLNVGIGSQMAMFETVIDSVTHIYPNLLKNKRRILFVAFLCAIFFLISLLFCTRAGMYIMLLCDWYVVAVSITCIGILEGVTVYWIYGHQRFYHDMELMVGHRPCVWWKICWGFICPTILIVLTVYNLVDFQEPYYGAYRYPGWAIGIGWTIGMGSFIMIPLFMLKAVIQQKGSLLQRMKKSLQPTKAWGPSDQEVRDTYKYAFYNEDSGSALFPCCHRTNQLSNNNESIALNKY